MAVTRSIRFALLPLVAVVAWGQPPPLRFAGVLRDAGVSRLCLIDPAEGRPHWVRVGDSVADYAVSAYDAAREVVTLTRAGESLQVSLERDRVAEGNRTLAPAEVAAIRQNLRLLLTAAKIHFLEGGVHYATFADLVGPGRPLERLTPVAGENYRRLTLMKGETDRLVVITATGEAVASDERGTEGGGP